MIDIERTGFHDEIKFRNCIFTNSAWEKALEGKCQPENVNHTQEKKKTRNKLFQTKKSKEGEKHTTTDKT